MSEALPGPVRQMRPRISAWPTSSAPETLQNPATDWPKHRRGATMMFTKALSIHLSRSAAVIALTALGIAAAHAQQATSPPSSASPSATKPAHGDHCLDRPNTAQSGKSDCERTSPSEGDRTASSSSSSSSDSSRSKDSSARSATNPSSSRSATSLPNSKPPSGVTPPAPPTPNEASSSRAQTTPRPVEHEPPVEGPATQLAPAPRP